MLLLTHRSIIEINILLTFFKSKSMVFFFRMKIKYIMIKNFIASSVVLFPFFTLSMDNVNSNLVMSEVFPGYVQRASGACSHDTICALALVNKKWNDIIKKTYVQRRIYFTSKQDYKDVHTANPHIYQQQIWHKYSSAYAYWMKTVTEVGTLLISEMSFNLIYMDGNDVIKSSEFKDVALRMSIFGDIQPFFTGQGNACFYAWSYEKKELLEILLSIKKPLKMYKCTLDLGEKIPQSSNYWIAYQPIESSNLNPFIIHDYPTLLKAFINSEVVQENKNEKIYHVEGVELTEDYLLQGKFPSQWWRNIVSQNCLIKK